MFQGFFKNIFSGQDRKAEKEQGEQGEDTRNGLRKDSNLSLSSRRAAYGSPT